MRAKVIGGRRIGMSQSPSGSMIGQASLGPDAARRTRSRSPAGSRESAGFCCSCWMVAHRSRPPRRTAARGCPAATGAPGTSGRQPDRPPRDAAARGLVRQGLQFAGEPRRWPRGSAHGQDEAARGLPPGQAFRHGSGEPDEGSPGDRTPSITAKPSSCLRHQKQQAVRTGGGPQTDPAGISPRYSRSRRGHRARGVAHGSPCLGRRRRGHSRRRRNGARAAPLSVHDRTEASAEVIPCLEQR